MGLEDDGRLSRSWILGSKAPVQSPEVTLKGARTEPGARPFQTSLSKGRRDMAAAPFLSHILLSFVRSLGNQQNSCASWGWGCLTARQEGQGAILTSVALVTVNPHPHPKGKVCPVPLHTLHPLPTQCRLQTGRRTSSPSPCWAALGHSLSPQASAQRSLWLPCSWSSAGGGCVCRVSQTPHPTPPHPCVKMLHPEPRRSCNMCRIWRPSGQPLLPLPNPILVPSLPPPGVTAAQAAPQFNLWEAVES